MQSQQYMTPNDVAKLLNFARCHVYACVRADKIPYLRTVGRVVFDPGEIEQWFRPDRNLKKEQKNDG